MTTEGEPRLFLGPSGSKIVHVGGQPDMTRGVENSISIDLGTKAAGVNSHQNGWVGNHLFRDPDQRIGTDYQDDVENQPLTLAGLSNDEQAAKAALKGALYGEVIAEATNPSADTVITKIRVNPPTGTFDFFTKSFSQNWQFQAEDPANERV